MQTYPNRELLIIADGEDVRDLVPTNDRIRLVQIEEGFSIGAKRNYGAVLAAGSIVAHWDDDDYSAPARLSDQISRLGSSGLAVTGYHSMRFTDGVKSWMYTGTPAFALGTSLCYTKDFWERNQFQALQVGEDNHFVSEAHRQRALVVAAAGDLMYATIHPGNTSPKQTSADNWRLL